MRFLATEIPGAWILEQERHVDDRGFFARTWCEEELSRRGLEARVAQCSISFNRRRWTLRGLHYQAPPFAEVKIVRCSRGALHDVAVDLRPDSATFRRSVAVELTADNGRALYVPRGFAHGFLTLADSTEVSYWISTPYRPDASRGIRYDDPFLGVVWPGPVEVIAARDRDYPDVTLDKLDELRGL